MKFYGVLESKKKKWEFAFVAQDNEKALKFYLNYLQENVPVGEYDTRKLFQYVIDTNKTFDLKSLYSMNEKKCICLAFDLDEFMPEKPLM